MKVAFIKKEIDFRLSTKSIMWEEIESLGSFNLHNIVRDVPFLGIILSTKADFLILEHWDTNKLAEYDVILTIGPILEKKINSKQLLCYFECEPVDLAQGHGNKNFIKVDQQPEFEYDYLLNNFSFENFQRNISCPYVYDVDLFVQISKLAKKVPGKLFKQKRTVLSTLQTAVTENFENRSFNDYCIELAGCEYAVNLCNNGAAGQVIADCCLLGVICFAREHKLMSKLLLPNFCYVNTEQDVIDKIDYLEKNNDFKLNLLQTINENVNRYISLNSFKQLIHKLYNNYNNN
jgi:hypothetical protein